MDTVPFTIDDVYEGFAEADGIAGFENDTLTLEFQTRDAFVGLVKSDPKRVDIPVAELAGVEVRQSFWRRTTLVIRVRSLRTLDAVPGHRQGELALRIKGRDREAARDLATEIELRVSELRLQKLDGADDPR